MSKSSATNYVGNKLDQHPFMLNSLMYKYMVVLPAKNQEYEASLQCDPV